MIDLRYVKKLIEIIDESTVDSIEITSDKGMKIRISKSPQQRGAVQVTTPVGQCRPSSPRRQSGRVIKAARGTPRVIKEDAKSPGRFPDRRSPTGARGEVADGRDVLQVAGTGREGVRRASAIGSRRGRRSASSRR